MGPRGGARNEKGLERSPMVQAHKKTNKQKGGKNVEVRPKLTKPPPHINEEELFYIKRGGPTGRQWFVQALGKEGTSPIQKAAEQRRERPNKKKNVRVVTQPGETEPG